MDNGRILILEDDAVLREALADVLSSQDYQVDVASAGATAVDMASQGTYDLIIADIRMKGISGLDALAQVKESQPDIGSLVITGYSTEADSIRAIQLGVGQYLKKPFEMATFLSAVEAVMTKRRAENKVIRREKALRRTALWALQVISRSLDLAESRKSGGPRPRLQLSQQASLLALRLQAGHALVQEVELATLAALLERDTDGDYPDFLVEGLSDGVILILKHLDEDYREAGSSTPLGARVVRAVVADRLGWDGVSLDPELSALLPALSQEAQGEPQTGLAQRLMAEARRRRGLLTLGRTLRQRGDAEQASQAFRAVLDQSANGFNREALEANLGLAELAMQAGQSDDAARLALEAANHAAGLTPDTAGLAQLEAGLLLLALNREEGRPMLEAAYRALIHSGDSPAAARAVLARLHFCGQAAEGEPAQALRTLLQTEHLGDLTASADWLLPLLLNQKSATPAVPRVLASLAREVPHRFRLFLDPAAAPPVRQAAAQALAESDHPGAAELLLPWQADSQSEVREAAQKAAGPGARLLPPVLRLFSFGDFEVVRGEERLVDWHSQKVRYLLACLAAYGTRKVSEDMIVDAFWPEDPEKGRLSVYTTCSHLRRQLRPKDWKQGEVNYVLRSPEGICLNPELPRWHDLDELEKALAEQSEEGWVRAARLYRGPYLQNCYLDWALQIRNRLEIQMLESLQQLSLRMHGKKQYRESSAYAAQALEIDACCQEAHLVIMKNLLAEGQAERAVRQFESCKKLLKQELQMEPNIPLLEWHQRALLNL